MFHRLILTPVSAITLTTIGLLGLSSLLAQDKQTKKGEPPQPLFAVELAATPGQTTKLTLRGLKFDGVTAVRVGEPKATAKLVGAVKRVGAPMNEYAMTRVGDRTIEIELTLPKEVAGKTVPLTLIGPGGESLPCRVLVNDDTPRIDEKEPNNRFREAQSLMVPVIVAGRINNPKDVDMYRIEGKAGQRLHLEIEAARVGSPMDALLILSDEQGRTLTQDDDSGPGGDPQIDWVLPADGKYLVTVLEANDFGSAERSPYRLARNGRNEPIRLTIE